MRNILSARVRNKHILFRADYNVPIKNGTVTNDKRIRATIPTLKKLLARGATLVIASHLGRPEGKKRAEFSLAPVARRLEKLLGKKVEFLPDCTGSAIERAVATSKNRIILLENLRFHPEEEHNDAHFAKQLARLANIYCNDAFGVSHRAHASVHAITRHLPSFAGPLLLNEITMLSALKKPKRPFIAVLGGAKVSDKIQLIEQLSKKADAVLIGGAMMFTFLAAAGNETGTSKTEKDYVPLARKLLRTKKINIPTDVVLDNKKTVSVHALPKNRAGLDIGPETRELYSAIIARAKTVFWNGPLGLFEKKPFDAGTLAIARAIAHGKKVSIIGGGDSVAAIEKLGLAKKFTHLSTGGGAALEFIEGKTLPGIAALHKNKPKRADKRA